MKDNWNKTPEDWAVISDETLKYSAGKTAFCQQFLLKFADNNILEEVLL